MIEIFHCYVFPSSLRPFTYEEFANLFLSNSATIALCSGSISSAVPSASTVAVAYPERVILQDSRLHFPKSTTTAFGGHVHGNAPRDGPKMLSLPSQPYMSVHLSFVSRISCPTSCPLPTVVFANAALMSRHPHVYQVETSY